MSNPIKVIKLTGVSGSLEGKADAVHTHELSDITDAGTAAASDTTDFAASSHTHPTGDITGLGSAATSDITDFADANHTHSLSEINDAGTAAASNVGDFAAASHTHVASDVQNLGSAALSDASDFAAQSHSHTYSDIAGVGSAATADVTDFATAAQGTLADSALQASDINTFAELNSILTDGNVIKDTDSRLSDARDPIPHLHTLSDISDAGSAAAADTTEFATAAQGVLANSALQSSSINSLTKLNNIVLDATLVDVTHTHLAADISSGTFADARISQSSVTQYEAALAITESQISDFGSYADLVHTHDAAAITTGVFADGRISASSVTQHEAALAITESQITDLGSYAAATHTHDATDITTGVLANARIPESGVTQHQAAIAITESQISDLGSTVTLNTDTSIADKNWAINENNLISNSSTQVPTQSSVKSYVDNNTTPNNSTDVSGVSWVLDEDDFVSDSDTQVPTQQSISRYIATSMGDTMEFKGNYNASTNTPDLDSPTAGTVLKGDVYYISTAGSTLRGIPLSIGDVVMARIDDPFASTDWRILQQSAVTLDSDTDVSSKAWVINENDLVSDSSTQVPTQSSVKSYVDSITTNPSGMNYRGDYNAATNTPDITTPPTGVLTGDTYTVTTGGAFLGDTLEDGDTIIANTDGASSFTDWAVVGGGSAANDEAYGGTWSGDTETSPSRNALYDKFESLTGLTEVVQDTSPQLGGDLDLNGFKNIVEGTDTVLGFTSSGSYSEAFGFEMSCGAVYSSDPTIKVIDNTFSNFYSSNLKLQSYSAAYGGTGRIILDNYRFRSAEDLTGKTGYVLKYNGFDIGLSPTLTASNDAYGPSWENDLGVATKNALFDKFENLDTGGGTIIGTFSTYDLQKNGAAGVAATSAGQFSVDLQGFRAAGTQFAGGISSTIGGGSNNTASGNYSTIAGGTSNSVIPANSTVAGGELNAVTDSSSWGAIGGGYQNNITGSSNYSGIFGGLGNTITNGAESFIGGGKNHVMNTTTSGTRNAILGGLAHNIQGSYCSIVGGSNNALLNGSTNSFIGAGDSNTTAAGYGMTDSFIGAGTSNTLSGYDCFIGAGTSNDVSGFFGGSYRSAVIAGTTNSVYYATNSTILNGQDNQINYSTNSVIGGRNVIIPSSNNNGIFAFADNNAVAFTVDLSNSAQFRVANGMHVTSSLFLGEQAAALADLDARGQIWVKSATPNELWFTDDTGTDYQLAPSAAGGDVTKVGTPVNNQIGVWTGDGTIEGDADFTWDETKLNVQGTGTMRFYLENTTGSHMGLVSGTNNSIVFDDGADLYIYPTTDMTTLAGSADPSIFVEGATRNVGIANDTPSEALDVTGNIAVSGTVDGVDIAARDHDSVTLAGTGTYVTIDAAQQLTVDPIDLTTDVTGDLPVTEGGTGASDAATARINLGVDAAGTVSIHTETAASYTAGANGESVIFADASSNAITVNLPAASSNAGACFYIKKVDSSTNTVTIDGNSTELIDDTQTKIISDQYVALKLVCDGTQWWII